MGVDSGSAIFFRLVAIFPQASHWQFLGRLARQNQILLVPGERFELPTNGLQKGDRHFSEPNKP
jgi:hypothetical protein